jgi:hypothetical protein
MASLVAEEKRRALFGGNYRICHACFIHKQSKACVAQL